MNIGLNAIERERLVKSGVIKLPDPAHAANSSLYSHKDGIGKAERTRLNAEAIRDDQRIATNRVIDRLISTLEVDKGSFQERANGQAGPKNEGIAIGIEHTLVLLRAAKT